MGGFGLGGLGSDTPQQSPRKPYTPRKPPVPRKRSRRRASGRRRSGSGTPRRRSSPPFVVLGSVDTILILKMFWWMMHGIIATMIIHFKTTHAHNYVAALLIMPEFSLDRIGIGYIFKGGSRGNSVCTAIFVGFSILVAVFMVGFGCAIKGLLMLTATHDLDDLALIAGIAAVMSTIVIGPVEMVRFLSLSVCWAVLLGLATYYVYLELVFLPALYILIMAVSAADYLLFHSGPTGSEDNGSWLS